MKPLTQCPMRSFKTQRYLRKISHGRSVSPEFQEIPFDVTGDFNYLHYQNKVNNLKEEWIELKKSLNRCHSNCSQLLRYNAKNQEHDNSQVRSIGSSFGQRHKPSLIIENTKSKIIANIMSSCDNSQLFHRGSAVHTINLNESTDISTVSNSQLSHARKKLHKISKLNIDNSDDTENENEKICVNKVISSTPAKNIFLLNCSSHIANPVKSFNQESKGRQFVTYTMEKSCSTNNIKRISKVVVPVIPYTCKIDESSNTTCTLRNQYFTCGKLQSANAKNPKKELVKHTKVESANNSINLSKSSLKEMKALPITSISKIIKEREIQRRSEIENIDLNRKNGPVECSLESKCIRKSINIPKINKPMKKPSSTAIRTRPRYK